MKEIQLQASLTKECLVTKDLLACSVGSGTVEVYATPMMIALMENTAASLLSQFLDEGETSVGIHMDTTHDAATPQGMKVQGLWQRSLPLTVKKSLFTLKQEMKKM